MVTIMAITDVVGGYVKLWVLSMGSVFLMLFVTLIVSQIADESVTTLFILAYNGSVGLFIIMCGLPVGFFVIIWVLLYNSLAPIMQPMAQAMLDLFVPIFSGMFVNLGILDAIVFAHPIAPASLNITESISAVTGLINAFAQFLLETGLETTESIVG